MVDLRNDLLVDGGISLRPGSLAYAIEKHNPKQLAQHPIIGQQLEAMTDIRNMWSDFDKKEQIKRSDRQIKKAEALKKFTALDDHYLKFAKSCWQKASSERLTRDLKKLGRAKGKFDFGHLLEDRRLPERARNYITELKVSTLEWLIKHITVAGWSERGLTKVLIETMLTNSQLPNQNMLFSATLWVAELHERWQQKGKKKSFDDSDEDSDDSDGSSDEDTDDEP
jgi:hypothetical protein